MTEETVNLPTVRYRDDCGQPTCAVDFETGKVCKFYLSRKFGILELCFFSNFADRDPETLQRRFDRRHYGTLIPLPQCPIWQDCKGEIWNDKVG